MQRVSRYKMYFLKEKLSINVVQMSFRIEVSKQFLMKFIIKKMLI